MADPLQALFEAQAQQDRFSVPNLSAALLASPAGQHVAAHHAAIDATLGKALADYVIRSVLRATYLIELVKHPKIDTTKFEVRWAARLPASDPRYATFDECSRIFEAVMAALHEAIRDDVKRTLLANLHANSMIPWEIPLDYRDRTLIGPIHTADNIYWMWDDLPTRVAALRAYLLSPETNPYAEFFEEAYAKIQVKTYLTDRVLTGAHKTNREKRWEAHPASVHFALRRSCMEIELVLIEQLCYFQGFPADLLAQLQQHGIIRILHEPSRCPITLDPLLFADLEREVNDPRHGKANFQVGHLNPLKALNDDPRSGHTALNISWISSDGNRIQGSLTLDETRALLERIQRNYEELGLGA